MIIQSIRKVVYKSGGLNSISDHEYVLRPVHCHSDSLSFLSMQ